MKLAELESSEAYLLKYGKNLSSIVLKLRTLFYRNEVLQICSYLKRFYSSVKINNIFFNCEHV